MGDASAVYRYGKAINDPIMQQFGAYLGKLAKSGDHIPEGKICDQLKSLTLMDELKNATAKEALVGDFWLPDTEVGGARDKEGSYAGFFFGAKGGFNDESHNHNDVGSCVMYYNGNPCIIDLGREEYNAKTFSTRRYEIWTMQSGFHNLPLINGTEQKDGKNFKARNSTFASNSKSVTFSTDISGAYPADAMVKRWIRTYTLNRGRNFVISDNYELSGQNKSGTSSNIITYCKVTEIKPGLLRFSGNGFTLDMKYNSKAVKADIEFINVTDRALKQYWPEGVTRVKLGFINPGLNGGQTVTFSPSVK
jgi:hypothetical protein